MIRLTILLILCLFGAMYLADNLPVPAPKPVAAVEPAQPVDPADAAPAVAAVTLPTPATVASDPDTAYFSTPRMVLPDGTLMAAPVAKAPPNETVNVVPEKPDQTATIRFVTSKRVNVRAGPSTQFEVVDQVLFADAVEIVGDPTGEWVHIRIQGDGVDGYMASRFLQVSAPTR
ncbi:MAG: SH3 domain-containing protein [Marinosulfonomonas sp.]|nr:SH3 domain-containing protein [Marinosulfonomonas sp.]